MAVPKLIGRKMACANSKFEVFFDDIEDANEGLIQNYVVVRVRGKPDHSITGTAVLPVMDGKVGLVKVYRHPLNRYGWEAPRGFVDLEEPLFKSALRELEEETGLSCAQQNLVQMGVVAPDSGIFSNSVALFVAMDCQPIREHQLNELGHEEFRFFSLEEVDQLISRGEIQDSYTLVVYYRYRLQGQKSLEKN